MDTLCYVLCLVIQLCPTLCNPMDCSPPGSSVHGDSPGKNTGVGCHALLQGIFPTQGSKPGLLHCRQTLYCLSHQGFCYTWRIPWTEEPGGLQSMGLQRVGHNGATFFFLMWWLVLCVSLAGQHYPVISSNMTLSAAVKMFCGYG